MKNVVLSLVLLLAFALLSAQILWQDEVVLRERYLLDWTNSSANTPEGGKLIVFTEGGDMNRGVWLQKLTAGGEVAWDSPVLISDSVDRGSKLAIVASADGNYFIRWVDAGIRIAKVTELGQHLWVPVVSDVFTGSVQGLVSLPDNAGGIYVLYGKSVTGFSTNIWCQHISSTGQLLIPDGGIELTNDVNQEDISSVRLASDGGLILSYALSTSNSHNYRFLHLTSDYQIAWRIQISPDTNDHSAWVRDILSPDGTNFTIIWNQAFGGQNLLQMQRIDLGGNLLFPSPILIATGSNALYSSALLGSDNSIIMSVHDGSNVPPIVNSIKKLSYSGAPLWGNGISLPDSILSMSALKADSDGGAFFCFKYMINHSSANQGTMLQHYDSNGQALLPGVGQILVPRVPYANAGSISTSVTDRVTSIWIAEREEKYGLYYQIRDLEGALITAQMMPFREVPGGESTLKGTVERSNDILAFWSDTRWANSSVPRITYYYQIVNPDGSLDLPADGAMLLNNAAGVRYSARPCYLENGTTLFFFIDDSGGYPKIQAQAVDPGGNVLWGPGGIVIVDPLSNTDISNLIVSAEGNSAFLAWSMLSADNLTRSYIQKVDEGAPQWGPTGIMLSSNTPGADLTEIPLAFEDGFVCLKVSTVNTTQRKIWLTHLEPDASLSPLWPAEGIVVDAVNATVSGSYQGICSVSQGVIVLAYGYHANEVFNHYQYSMIDSQANVIVSHAVLLDSVLDQTLQSFDNHNGFAFSVRLANWDFYRLEYAYNRIGQNGNLLWGPAAPLVESEHEALSYIPQTIGFANGGCAIYWLSGSSTYCGYVNPSGEYIPLFDDQPIFPKCKAAPRGNLLNNELYLTWDDYKAAYSSSEGTEIRMQKLANTTVALDDPLSPPLTEKMSCYPNPFNPQTTLSFKLPEAGKIRLDVFNMRGQLVRCLLESSLEAGVHQVVWNGKDDAGRDSASGVYFFKLQARGSHALTKGLLLK